MFNKPSDQEQLNARRQEILSEIRIAQLDFEVMVQRASRAGEAIDDSFLSEVRERLEGLETQAQQAANIEALDLLSGDAERQGQLRAYICPVTEIANEARMALDVMEEWNVPKTAITKLRNSVIPIIDQAEKHPAAARGALRTIYEESDSWGDYTEEYEETMTRYARWLLIATLALPVIAILISHWPLTTLGSIFCAGVAGSCASVAAKMPLLDVRPSGELDAYGRLIFGRIGVGTIASLIGCALLGWGVFPISIQNQSFADALNGCTAQSLGSCTGLKTLILLGVPMLFGFSERALASFEDRVLGSPKGGQVKRHSGLSS
jgi:hypothetical protein